jgi:hypothetical protein
LSMPWQFQPRALMAPLAPWRLAPLPVEPQSPDHCSELPAD